ncbi:MAG TPA: AraC family transcriptional regulator [Bryobacteraceae bacterium]|jgi:AraC-like DNA-binding protein|nr:AraC family transcriptional regulator [Bryobacteraceae bacterium]
MERQRPILNSLSAPLGTHNAILRARSRTHIVKDFAGPLSIKSVTAGTVAWKSGGRELVVDRDSFLVLQDGEPYSMNIDSRMPVGTLCVFFQHGFAESVQASLTQDALDAEPAPTAFLGHLHTRDNRILPRMQAIANAPEASRLWLDEQFLLLARDLLLLDRDLRRRIGLMPARRPSTREELFRRVRRGQEFLHANSSGDLNLTEIARQSCLSPYHFHRAFTRAFGRTPHQYRNDLRLAQARRLLETTGQTITEICGAVGFQSAPSFSTLFRQSFGVPPSATRKLSNSR